MLGADAANTKALIFNVKGEDLLFLDHPNTELTADQPARYARLGLPAGPFGSVAFFAPPVRDDPNATPDVASRPRDVTSFFWTIRQFCEDELLPFLFADARGRPPAVHDGRPQRDRPPEARRQAARRRGGRGRRQRGRAPSTTWSSSSATRSTPTGPTSGAAGPSAPAPSTPSCGGCTAPGPTCAALIRADVPRPEAHQVDFDRAQVTVVDLHNLNDRAKRFVVGVVLRPGLPAQGAVRPVPPAAVRRARRAQQVRPAGGVEPDQGDPARRGRARPVRWASSSSAPSRRPARSSAASWPTPPSGWWAGSTRPRRRGASTGSCRRSSASGRRSSSPARCWSASPRCPIPLVVQFPFPAWATRASEAATGLTGPAGAPDGRSSGARGPRRRPVRRVPRRREAAPHLRLARRQGRAGPVAGPPSTRPCWPRSRRMAEAESVDLVVVAGDLFDTATPTAESERIVYRALLDLAAGGRPVVVIAGNHDSAQRLAAVAPLSEASGIHVASSIRPPARRRRARARRRRASARCVALVPFPSQRYVVTADHLLARRRRRRQPALPRPGGPHRRRAHRRLPCRHGQPGGRPPHGPGRQAGGGERGAHTVFDYWVPAVAFPSTAHYVALGHLHRAQRLDGPGAAPLLRLAAAARLRRGGQRAVGERGRGPARAAGPGAAGARSTAGRRLRTLRGTRGRRARAGRPSRRWPRPTCASCWTSPARVGLADEVRAAVPAGGRGGAGRRADGDGAHERDGRPRPPAPHPARPVRRVPGRA